MANVPYVDMAYVKAVGFMPAGDIDNIEAQHEGTFAAVALAVSRRFDGRLMKRYATPFVVNADLSENLKYHVAQMVCCELYRKRGYNPGSQVEADITNARQEVSDWLKEASDAKDGLEELPARELTTGDEDAVVRGGPIMSTEGQGPYALLDEVFP